MLIKFSKNNGSVMRDASEKLYAYAAKVEYEGRNRRYHSKYIKMDYSELANSLDIPQDGERYFSTIRALPALFGVSFPIIVFLCIIGGIAVLTSSAITAISLVLATCATSVISFFIPYALIEYRIKKIKTGGNPRLISLSYNLTNKYDKLCEISRNVSISNAIENLYISHQGNIKVMVQKLSPKEKSAVHPDWEYKITAIGGAISEKYNSIAEMVYTSNENLEYIVSEEFIKNTFSGDGVIDFKWLDNETENFLYQLRDTVKDEPILEEIKRLALPLHEVNDGYIVDGYGV